MLTGDFVFVASGLFAACISVFTLGLFFVSLRKNHYNWMPRQIAYLVFAIVAGIWFLLVAMAFFTFDHGIGELKTPG